MSKTAVHEVKNEKKVKTVKSLFKVEFETAKNSKKYPGQTLTGDVTKSFICPKTHKEFYRIKTDKGVFLKKAEACKKI